MNSIAERNDRARSDLMAGHGHLMLTHGVRHLDNPTFAKLLLAVAQFNTFDEGDDPYGEHDFGKVTLLNTDYFWKIEDHGGHDGYGLVMTIMRADEY